MAACEPGSVDVLELLAEEMPGQPLGRHLTVRMADAAGAVVTCALEATPPVWRQLVPLGATWRYRDDGVDPGPEWAQPSYDDSGWATGPAPLGFGADAQVLTQFASGALVPPPVTWFRTSFSLDDPDAVRQLRVQVRRDDGVVVYVNGQEILRDNVPVEEPAWGNDGRVLYTTTLDVPAGLLVAGDNAVAVELHQQEGSSDAAFHFRLAALVDEPPVPEVHLVESPDPATEHRLALYGLMPEATYACVARSTTCAESARTAEATVVTAPLEAPVPDLALEPERRPATWGAYTLFNHQRPCVDDHDNRLVIVDPDGRVRWVHEIGMSHRSSIDIEAAVIGPDEVLWCGGQQPEGSPQIVGLDGETRYVATYPGASGHVYHHDVERHPDGRLIGIIESRVDGVTHDWTGFELIEHDPATGEITWAWDAETAFDRGQLPPAAVGDYDPYHANALSLVDDADGEGVYISLLYSKEIVRVDRASADLIWHIGRGGDFTLVDPNGAPLPDDAWFDEVHGVNVYGDLLYMYDNGSERRQSRAMALRFDAAAKTAELAWSWTEFGWFEPHWGDVDELPSGAVLITMAHAWCHDAGRDHPSALVEVDPVTQEVVWRLDFLDVDDSTYRGQRIDGCAVFANSRFCPEVAERVEAWTGR